MNNLLQKIEGSFKKSMNGEESVNVVIWWWGVTSYVVSYFVIDKVIKANDFKSIDILISLVMVVYFIWHIYVLHKCKPKNPKLTKEEKKLLKIKRRKEFGKKFMRKLFLREPIGDWDPIFITTVIDLFCMAHFLGYVLR